MVEVVAEVVGSEAQLKWPNDVLVGGRKVAGILVEGRPQEGWAVVGIGLNVAVRGADFPAELRETELDRLRPQGSRADRAAREEPSAARNKRVS